MRLPHGLLPLSCPLSEVDLFVKQCWNSLCRALFELCCIYFSVQKLCILSTAVAPEIEQLQNSIPVLSSIRGPYVK